MGQAKLRGTRAERVEKAKNKRIFLDGTCPVEYIEQNNKNIIDVLESSQNDISKALLPLKKSIKHITGSIYEIPYELAMETAGLIFSIGGAKALRESLCIFNNEEIKILNEIWSDFFKNANRTPKITI